MICRIDYTIFNADYIPLRRLENLSRSVLHSHWACCLCHSRCAETGRWTGSRHRSRCLLRGSSLCDENRGILRSHFISILRQVDGGVVQRSGAPCIATYIAGMIQYPKSALASINYEANLFGASSGLYRSRSLQPNIHSASFFKIYNI